VETGSQSCPGQVPSINDGQGLWGDGSASGGTPDLALRSWVVLGRAGGSHKPEKQPSWELPRALAQRTHRGFGLAHEDAGSFRAAPPSPQFQSSRDPVGLGSADIRLRIVDDAEGGRGDLGGDPARKGSLHLCLVPSVDAPTTSTTGVS
jgi:hypothetical protein